MRFRVILLVVATSSLVLVSFLVPLALVLRSFAANQAVSKATTQAQQLAPLVATLPTDTLRATVDRANVQAGGSPVTVFMPSGQEFGQPALRSATVGKAATTASSFTTAGPAGAEVLAAVQGLPARPPSRAGPRGPR